MLASASITLTSLTDGLTTFYQYAKNTSDTTPPTTGWSAAMPSRASGEFIWRREVSAISLADVTAWTAPMCLTGAKGDKGDTGPKGEPGEQGPSGNPGAVGVNPNGNLIQVAGFEDDGTFGASTGIVYNGSTPIHINNADYTVNEDGKGYIFTNSSGNLSFGRIHYRSVGNGGIGKRNLLRDSGVLHSNSGYPVATYPFTVNIPAGKEVTLTIKGNLNRTRWGIYNSGGSVNITSIYATEGVEGVYQKTFPWTVGSSTNTSLYVYPMDSTEGGVNTIESIKLEYGSVATEWTPAPEDLEDSQSSLKIAFADFNTYEEIYPDIVIGTFLVENGLIESAEMLPARYVNDFLNSNMLEILNRGDKEDIKVMAMALGADRVFQTIVAITAFIQDLYVNNVKSKDYYEDPDSLPEEGFWLDGINNIAKIAYLKAKNADIQGTFRNDGFKTLKPVDGTTVTTYYTPKSIFKFSDAFELIPNSESFQLISGTFEGNSFTQATRRTGQRVLFYRDTSTTSLTVKASSNTRSSRILKRNTPTQVLGKTFFVKWNISYPANMAHRHLMRIPEGMTDPQLISDWANIIGNHDLWDGGSGSGTYSGTYTISDTYNEIGVIAHSSAVWGEASASSNLLEVSTSRTFTGAVLVNGSTYKEVSDQPEKYYLSSSKTFNIGGTTQDSSTMKKYVSGTDFYNKFSNIPVGTVADTTSGVINYNGVSYPVGKIQKTSNSIVFWSGSSQFTINKFVNGTNIGVYTQLDITSNISIGNVPGGIETMNVLPYKNVSDMYDIGQFSQRFRYGYFKELSSVNIDASNTVSGVNGNFTTVDATTVNANSLRPSNISYSIASGNGGTVTMTTVPAIGGFIAAINNNSSTATRTSRYIKLPPTGKYLCNVFLRTAQTYNSSRIYSGGSTIGASSTEVVQIFGVRIE